MHEIIEITPRSKHYSKILKEIADPPRLLYCRGNLNLLNTFCFGVVGSRMLTSYGKEATQHIVQSLVREGFTIISGLALGIDSVAHKATLDNGGKTIAVLGTGINDESVYPNTNLNLAKQILAKDGLIVSEYPPGEVGYKSNFPARNRIISGLSKGVLVVEADEKSGSLITAKSAAEQNRDVFAIPGSIFSSKSRGANALIKSGAKLVASTQDILEEYSKNAEFELQPKNDISTKDPVEKKILDILDEKESLGADEIIRESDEETSKVLAALSMLEIKGKIKNLGNGQYRKT